MSLMLKEIAEQPRVLQDVFSKEKDKLSQFAGLLHRKNIRFIGFVARGTSDHAATLAKYVFEVKNQIPVFHIFPSTFTRYGATLDLKNFLIIGISQSGESTDVVAVMKKAKTCGALTCAITNGKNSSLARCADTVFFLHAGKERALAATKTYTATLYVLFLLSSLLANDKKTLDTLKKIPERMRDVLSLDAQIQSLCQQYRYLDECAVLARGFNLATAQETALKLEETCEVKALSFSAADFLHGPIVLAEKDFPVFVYAAKGKTFSLMKDTIKTLLQKKADVCVISNVKDGFKDVSSHVHIPAPVDEMFTPLLFIASGQLFAYHIAVLKGLNPDKPRYLTKVTRTL